MNLTTNGVVSYRSGPKPVALSERFWSKVRVSAGCWLWQGCRQGFGYGRVGVEPGRTEFAHRVSWLLSNGPIPDGQCVLHRCDNPPCVNPDHLFLGTKPENLADMFAKGRNVRSAGERNGNAKLTWMLVREIRAVYARGGHSYRSLAAKFSIGKTAVEQVIKAGTWRDHQEKEKKA